MRNENVGASKSSRSEVVLNLQNRLRILRIDEGEFGSPEKRRINDELW